MAGVTRELQKFDAISVREESGVRVLKDEFGIKGTQVLDPVFLLDENDYNELVKESNLDIQEELHAGLYFKPYR